MLKRREFLQVSGTIAAGVMVSTSLIGEALAAAPRKTSHPARPVYRFHGDKKSGCAFRPELVDLWEGGGAQLPDMV